MLLVPIAFEGDISLQPNTSASYFRDIPFNGGVARCAVSCTSLLWTMEEMVLEAPLASLHNPV